MVCLGENQEPAQGHFQGGPRSVPRSRALLTQEAAASPLLISRKFRSSKERLLTSDALRKQWRLSGTLLLGL